jgi:hypothetical protein
MVDNRFCQPYRTNKTDFCPGQLEPSMNVSPRLPFNPGLVVLGFPSNNFGSNG